MRTRWLGSVGGLGVATALVWTSSASAQTAGGKDQAPADPVSLSVHTVEPGVSQTGTGAVNMPSAVQVAPSREDHRIEPMVTSPPRGAPLQPASSAVQQTGSGPGTTGTVTTSTPPRSVLRTAVQREQNGAPSREAILAAREAGEARLAGDLQAVRPRPSPALPVRTGAALPKQKLPPQKMPLSALPPSDPANQAECSRAQQIGELQRQVEEEPDTALRERKLLVLAAAQVGNDDWQAAAGIYGQLAATSTDPAVLEAVRRNQRVVTGQLAVLASRDADTRESRELDLANTHQDLGHELAAKRIYWRLASTATQPAVRTTAIRLLEQPFEPTDPLRLPAPPAGGSAGKEVQP